MKVCIDPGHGGRDPGAQGNGLREADITLDVGLRLRRLLEARGIGVVMTRETDAHLGPDTVTDLQRRCDIANRAQANVYVSIHVNSTITPTARGTETYALAPGGQGEKLARLMQARLVDALEFPDRGVKFARFYVLRNTAMPAALTELGFIRNPEDASALALDRVRQATAQAIADAVAEYFSLPALAPQPAPQAGPAAPAAGTPILGPAQATAEQAKAWARSRGATDEFIGLADLYWRLAPARGGVRADVAFCQAAKETGFGRFGGVIDASYHNPCGLKVAAGGGNDDPRAHQRFLDWETGVTAHLDHLALYAGAPGYPRGDTPDPRHFPAIRGVAPIVEALGGKWAPNPGYGASIVGDYLAPLLATPAPPALAPGECWVEAGGQRLRGRLIDGAAWAPVRPVAEALGATVTWDGDSRTVRIARL